MLVMSCCSLPDLGPISSTGKQVRCAFNNLKLVSGDQLKKFQQFHTLVHCGTTGMSRLLGCAKEERHSCRVRCVGRSANDRGPEYGDQFQKCITRGKGPTGRDMPAQVAASECERRPGLENHLRCRPEGPRQVYRGRDDALDCAAPPSEPCVRFSRTRLSS